MCRPDPGSACESNRTHNATTVKQAQCTRCACVWARYACVRCACKREVQYACDATTVNQAPQTGEGNFTSVSPVSTLSWHATLHKRARFSLPLCVYGCHDRYRYKEA